MLRKRKHIYPRRFWTSEELDLLRLECAKGFDRDRIPKLFPKRTLGAIYQTRKKLGLARKLIRHGDRLRKFIRAKHRLGWSDAEMGAAWSALHPDRTPCDRHVISRYRRRMGLGHNAYSEHRRRLVGVKTRQQLAAAGLPTLAALHRKVVEDRIAAMGWPTNLRWREAQVLSLIWDRGPLTKRQICSGLGMPVHEMSRKMLKDNDAGNYLASLMRKGLLISLRRAIRMGGKGHNVDLYTLPLNIERRKVNGNAKQGQPNISSTIAA
jgi:hypothetical protein